MVKREISGNEINFIIHLEILCKTNQKMCQQTTYYNTSDKYIYKCTYL